MNEPHYLCRLQHAVDPSYCPGDLFLESPDAHYTFVLVFAPFTRWMSLSALAWLGRFICWTLVAWAWRRLSWTVVPRPLFAALAAALVIVGIAEGNFAGEWLVGGFESKPIAYAFVLLGLRSWILNKWNWTWIHFGIASAWHALVGGWSVLILLALWLAGWRRQQSLVGMLPGLLLGGVISLAGIIPALSTSAGAAPEVRAEAAQVYVFERLPHHLAPLHKPAEWIAERALRHSTVATLFALLFVLRLRTLRMEECSTLRDDPACRMAFYAAGAIVLALIGVVIELAFWNHPATSASLLRYYWFRIVDVAVPMAAALLWIRLLADLLAARYRWAPAMLAIMLLVAGVPLGLELRDYTKKPVAVSDARRRDVSDWLDVCTWVKENTPSDALFLTPRGNTSFKWHAERAEVVTYKDIPQNATGLIEWRQRLYDVFKPDGDPDALWVGNLGELGTARIMHLADKYNSRYVLTRHGTPVSLPIAYDNETYVVYEIQKSE
ncbi:hypothetical protein NG895_11300 [Aeoliella sp. ICT_H6.2]|uniref:DUF6798 domain-containing protein n=1 Tax=Aeoliella straminimaris TaxID=2954799 RepID=A0A9X2FH56_9BACT|nr:DUF6798 domain-containing protein [Aeoliella straminimaris]MCO6044491.1 hypothetical protein [Aeoliella straminimaris]